jgi:ATP-dependent 26S proteasome regulatory subunit
MSKRKKTAAMCGIAVLCVGSLVWWWTRDSAESIGTERLAEVVGRGDVEKIVVAADEVRVYCGEKTYRFHKEQGTPLHDLLAKLGIPPDLAARLPVEVAAPSFWRQDWVKIVGVFVLLAILLFALVWFIDWSRGARAEDFNRIKPRLPPDTYFRDIAGYAGVKTELAEVVDFLRSPLLFRTLAIKPPSTILLIGPPGTGKTMFARAIARAAGARVLAASGAEFVRLYVGVGAETVRKLFADAGDGPALIFVDELDALAARRSADPLGRHQEHDSTLNELLTQLDGFSTRRDRPVVFVGATNRDDVLDPALVQRMTRLVQVPIPTFPEREAILGLYADRAKIDWTPADLRETAARTTGFAGRELANLMNEAGRLALRRRTDAARVACRAYPSSTDARYYALPGRGAVSRGLVPCGGQCEPGASVAVTFVGAETHTFAFQDDDDDGVWCGVVALPPGKYEGTYVIKKARTLTATFQFQVAESEKYIGLDDVKAALRRLGIFLPRSADLDSWRAELDHHLHENSPAKQLVTRAAAIHYATVMAGFDGPPPPVPRHVMLVTGPRGSGKTILVRGLAAALRVPFAQCEAITLLTARDGMHTLLRRLLDAARGETARAECGIVCVENLDMVGRAEGGRAVEWMGISGLAEFLDGEPIELYHRGTAGVSTVRLATRGILLVIAGASPEADRPGAAPDPAAGEQEDSRADRLLERLESAGWPVALLNRVFPAVSLAVLTADQWQTLLGTDGPGNPLRQFEPIWRGQGHDPKFESEAWAALAEELAKRAPGGTRPTAILQQLVAFILARDATKPLTIDRAAIEAALGLRASVPLKPGMIATRANGSSTAAEIAELCGDDQ